MTIVPVLLPLLALAAAPAPTVKPVRITVPSRTFATPDAKLCMPRQTSPVLRKDKSLPLTLCKTRTEWSEQGVEINTK